MHLSRMMAGQASTNAKGIAGIKTSLEIANSSIVSNRKKSVELIDTYLSSMPYQTTCLHLTPIAAPGMT